jgi:hypothetical protein
MRFVAMLLKEFSYHSRVCVIRGLRVCRGLCHVRTEVGFCQPWGEQLLLLSPVELK